MHHPRSLAYRVLRCAAVLLCSALPASLAAQTTSTRPTTPTSKPVNIQQELDMTASDAALRPTLMAFITAASGGKTKQVADLISGKMRANAGAEAVTGFVNGQIVPFFEGVTGLAPNMTITNTTDGFGQQGHAYYGYVVSGKAGAPRPFVMYVVVEDGHPVVANVLVNKFVEGRHKQ